MKRKGEEKIMGIEGEGRGDRKRRGYAEKRRGVEKGGKERRMEKGEGMGKSGCMGVNIRGRERRKGDGIGERGVE